MKWLAALALCSGCHKLFGLDDLNTPPDAGVDSPGITSACFLYDFDASALDTMLWSITDADNKPVIVEQTGGRLALTLPPNLTAQNYNGIESHKLYDLTDATLQIEIVQAANPGSNVDTQFFIVDAQRANFYMFDVANGQLIFYLLVNGTIAMNPTIFYSPTAHRFVRFQHLEATHEVVYSVSPDGVTFAAMQRMPDTISVKRMFIGAAAGTYATGSANPGSPVFDNFIATAPGC